MGVDYSGLGDGGEVGDVDEDVEDGYDEEGEGAGPFDCSDGVLGGMVSGAVLPGFGKKGKDEMKKG